jgi:hypothetical protein
MEAVMRPMTAEQRAEIDARLDALLEEIRDMARRLDAVTAALPATAA